MISVLPGHWVLQGHVLGSCEGQSVSAVVVHQFRDAGKDAAALVQRVAQALAAFSLRHDDVHTALAGPNRAGQNKTKKTFKLNRIGHAKGEDGTTGFQTFYSWFAKPVYLSPQQLHWLLYCKLQLCYIQTL